MGKKRVSKAKPNLRQLQRQTYTASRQWHQDIDLELCGVDLGRCLEYVMIQQLNNHVKGDLDDDK